MRANAQDDMEPIDDALARDFPTIAKMRCVHALRLSYLRT